MILKFVFVNIFYSKLVKILFNIGFNRAINLIIAIKKPESISYGVKTPTIYTTFFPDISVRNNTRQNTAHLLIIIIHLITRNANRRVD